MVTGRCDRRRVELNAVQPVTNLCTAVRRRTTCPLVTADNLRPVRFKIITRLWFVRGHDITARVCSYSRLLPSALGKGFLRASDTSYKLRRMGNLPETNATLHPLVPASRSVAVDIVRICGIVAIVAGHITSDGIVGALLYTWHVPLFFILSGYLWTPGRSFSREVSTRFKSIVVPAVAWAGIIFALYTVARAAGFQTGASGLVPMSAYIAYWFVPALFFVALLLRLIEAIPAWIGWALGGFGLLTTYLIPVLLSEIPLYLGVVLPSLCFVLIGEAVRAIRARISVPIATFLLVLSAALVTFGIARPLNMKEGDFGTPVVSVLVAGTIVASGIVIVENIAPRLPLRVAALAAPLAQAGWTVVLVHAALILVMRQLGLPNVAVFGIALVIPWAVGLAALRTPAARLLTGSRRVALTG